MPVAIQPARTDERTRLSELAVRSKAHWGYSAEFLESCREELGVEESAIVDGNVFVVADRRGVLGFYSLEHLSSDDVELGHLFVDPPAIGLGHGRALLQHACEVARSRGYSRLLIQGDPNAESFYASAGALRVGSRESASFPDRHLPLLEISLTSDPGV